MDEVVEIMARQFCHAHFGVACCQNRNHAWWVARDHRRKPGCHLAGCQRLNAKESLQALTAAGWEVKRKEESGAGGARSCG